MDNVSKNTQYLIVLGETLENGHNVSSGNKFKAAAERNVRILSLSEFCNIVSDAVLHKERASSSKGKAPGKRPLGSTNNKLWTDKHKPKSTSELLGNGGIVRNLKKWLEDWHSIHVAGTKKVRFNAKLTENLGAKTALLSGPPGIGKSTMATLISRECGFDVTELNASDVRSKKAMTTGGLMDVAQSSMISFDGNSKKQLKKRVLIFDEVDGMSSGDRSGISALLDVIKKSKTPIICICNDRQSQKIKSLAGHSYDLRFRRPTKNEIASRCVEIAKSEGMNVEKNALVEVTECFGNDIRQVLNFLQMWNRRNSTMTYDDVRKQFYQMKKDDVLRLNPFNALQQIFKSDLSFNERTEMYFVDYDLMPLMVQENYITSVRSNKSDQELQLEQLSKASEYISESDLLSNYVRKQMRWDLLTKQAAMNVAASIEAQGFVGRPEFSRWMGKNSTTGKAKRLVQELSIHMRSATSTSFEATRLDYIPYLKDILLTKLFAGPENFDQVIELMDACQISREDMTESFEFFKFNDVKRQSYSELDAKLKRAFTSAYNKVSHRQQVLVEAQYAGVKAKKGKAKVDEEDEDQDEDEIKEEKEDLSMFAKKKPRKAAAAKGKGKGRLIKK